MATTKETKTTEAATPTFAPAQGLSYVDFLTQACDGLLEVLNAQQDQMLKIAQAVVDALPQVADFNIPMPAAPTVDVPTARDVVEVGFKFADKYLANQRAYTEKFLALGA
jgi:hypothetical protein